MMLNNDQSICLFGICIPGLRPVLGGRGLADLWQEQSRSSRADLWQEWGWDKWEERISFSPHLASRKRREYNFFVGHIQHGVVQYGRRESGGVERAQATAGAAVSDLSQSVSGAAKITAHHLADAGPVGPGAAGGRLVAAETATRERVEEEIRLEEDRRRQPVRSAGTFDVVGVSCSGDVVGRPPDRAPPEDGIGGDVSGGRRALSRLEARRTLSCSSREGGMAEPPLDATTLLCRCVSSAFLCRFSVSCGFGATRQDVGGVGIFDVLDEENWRIVQIRL